MFTELEEIITLSGGEINKYMGDAILAFFPFPNENPQPAVRKVLQSALRMQDSFHEVQAKFRETYSEIVQTGMGIGIAGGDVILGNLGSTRRMEFTLIGDTVNLASRLCSIAEDGQILVNTEIAHVAADQFRMEALDPVRIKGKAGTYTPYAVMGERIQQGLA
jgi:adenylate cyclase